MRAMVLEEQPGLLSEVDLPVPDPGPGQLLIRVQTCGVCRTDLHIVDGDLTKPKLPLVPGHQIVGTVEACGPGSDRFVSGDRVGVPWLGWTDGTCRFCQEGRENLCARALFHGYTRDGGYAELMAVDSRFALPLDPDPPAAELAPLLCAGLIGYRALRMCADAGGCEGVRVRP